MGFKQFIGLVQSPTHFFAHNAAVSHNSLDGKVGGGFIELSAYLHGLKDTLHQCVAPQLGVRVYVRIEVLQQPLGGVLLYGELVGAEQIRHLAGGYFGSEFGETGIPVFLSIILRIVIHFNSVFSVCLVEFNDFSPQIVIKIHAGQGEYGLLFNLRGGFFAEKGYLDVALTLIVPTIGEADNSPVLHGYHCHQIVLVNIAAYPVEELFPLACLEIITVEVGTVTVVKGVLAVAVIDVVYVHGQGHILTPALCGNLNGF